MVRLFQYLNPFKHPPKVGRSKEYDQLTIDFVKNFLSPNSSVVDIGASCGELFSKISSILTGGKHVLFEANPKLAKQLVDQFPHCQIISAALADSNSPEVLFYISENAGFSSLNPKSPLDHGHRRPIYVSQKKIDDYKLTNIDLIKIDIEGAETFALRGAKQTLQNHSPYLIFEHGRALYKNFSLSGLEIFNDLTNLGYCIWPLSSDFFNTNPLSKLEFSISCHRALNYMYIAKKPNQEKPIP